MATNKRAIVRCRPDVAPEGTIAVDVVARRGVLIAHRKLSGKGWAISHEPSGTLVWSFRRKVDVIKALREIAALPIDWPNVTPGPNPLSPEARDAFAAIVGKY